jgi:hypothetical protein
LEEKTMNRFNEFRFPPLAIVARVVLAGAAGAQAVNHASPASLAFARRKAPLGSWTAESPKGTASVTCEPIARRTALVQ